MAGMATSNKIPKGRGAIMRQIAALHVQVSESKAQEREKLKQRIAVLTQQMMAP